MLSPVDMAYQTTRLFHACF